METASTIENQPSSKNIKEDFEHPISREIFEIMKNLVRGLKGNLSSYETILSDDAGARPIALILRNVINTKRRAQEKSEIMIRHIASGRKSFEDPEINEDLSTFIGKNSDSFGKTLVVTELISSGKSMAHLAQLLKNHQIDFDIAALSTAREPSRLPPILRDKVYYGEIGEFGYDLYSRPEIIGVTKYGMTEARDLSEKSGLSSRASAAVVQEKSTVIKEKLRKTGKLLKRQKSNIYTKPHPEQKQERTPLAHPSILVSSKKERESFLSFRRDINKMSEKLSESL